MVGMSSRLLPQARDYVAAKFLEFHTTRQGVP